MTEQIEQSVSPEEQAPAKVLTDVSADHQAYRMDLLALQAPGDNRALAQFGDFVIADENGNVVAQDGTVTENPVVNEVDGEGGTGGGGGSGRNGGPNGENEINPGDQVSPPTGGDRSDAPPENHMDRPEPPKEVKPEEKLAEDHGLRVDSVTVDGRREFVYYTTDSDGKRVIVASGNDVAEVERNIKKWEDKKVKDIESKYGVDILQDGESNRSGVEARTPTAGELLAMEAALKRSQPSQLREDGEPLQIVIPKERSSDFAGYYFGKDGDQPATIVIEPDQFDLNNPDYFTEVLAHELAHAGQDQYIHNDKEREKAYGEKFGFIKVDDRWLMQTEDQPPQYFEYKERKNDQGETESYWARTDEKGGYVDAAGDPVDSAEKAEQITPDQMRDRAKVTPISGYFPNPIEMGAEAMAIYRKSPESRARMIRENPELYEIAKQQDQKEINAQYGYKFEGGLPPRIVPKMIRNENGELVDNNKENRLAIALWEEKIRDQKRLPGPGASPGHGGSGGDLGPGKSGEQPTNPNPGHDNPTDPPPATGPGDATEEQKQKEREREAAIRKTKMHHTFAF